jgi:hypothetical protein
LGLRIIVEIPALDRLVTYLEGAQQVQIDSLSEQVAALTQALQTHRTGLETAIEGNK